MFNRIFSVENRIIYALTSAMTMTVLLLPSQDFPAWYAAPFLIPVSRIFWSRGRGDRSADTVMSLYLGKNRINTDFREVDIVIFYSQ